MVFESIVDDGSATGPGVLAVDPLFVDAGGEDYRLGTGSPGIDAGDSNQAPAGILVDLGGRPRFRDDPATSDLGVGFPAIEKDAE